MRPTIYKLHTEVHVIRVGEIVVELHPHNAYGWPLEPTFARFRSRRRAERFAALSRSKTCKVKAWLLVSDDLPVLKMNF